MEADRHIAAILRLPHGQDFVGGGRLGVAEEGRAEQLQRAPGERLEQPLRRIQLEQGAGVVRRRKIGMGVGVTPDFMTLAQHAFEKRALGQRIFADDEERRGNVLGLENVENSRRPAGVRAVVESERDQAGLDSRSE